MLSRAQLIAAAAGASYNVCSELRTHILSRVHELLVNGQTSRLREPEVKQRV